MLLTIHLFLLTFICVEYLPVLMTVHHMHAGARKGLRAPGIGGTDGWAVVLRLWAINQSSWTAQLCL